MSFEGLFRGSARPFYYSAAIHSELLPVYGRCISLVAREILLYAEGNAYKGTSYPKCGNESAAHLM